MRPRFSFPAVCFFTLLVTVALAPAASAQARLDIFVTPFPNAPFSGVIEVQRSVVRPDGSVMEWKTIRNIGRDSKGRIYNESRTLVPAASTAVPALMGVHLYDPQTRTSAMLNIQQRTYVSGTVNRPPETLPPVLLSATPAGSAAPQNEFTKQEDLGNREMDGVAVHGVRETQIISADDSGTGKDMAVTDEYWYSADLRINMLIKHNDPRTGSVTMTVTHVSRSEPDPSFLQIPDGFVPAGSGPAPAGSAPPVGAARQ